MQHKPAVCNRPRGPGRAALPAGGHSSHLPRLHSLAWGHRRWQYAGLALRPWVVARRALPLKVAILGCAGWLLRWLHLQLPQFTSFPFALLGSQGYFAPGAPGSGKPLASSPWCPTFCPLHCHERSPQSHEVPFREARALLPQMSLEQQAAALPWAPWYLKCCDHGRSWEAEP